MAPPGPPSCYGLLHRVFHLENQGEVTPFHPRQGRLSTPRPRGAPGAPPALRSPQNSSQAPDEPPLRPPPSQRASPRLRGSRSRLLVSWYLASRSRRLPSCGWKEDPPRSHQAAGKVCARPRSARNSRWPGAPATSATLQPPGSPTALGARTTCRGARASPSVPDFPTPPSCRGVRSGPRRPR